VVKNNPLGLLESTRYKALIVFRGEDDGRGYSYCIEICIKYSGGPLELGGLICGGTYSAATYGFIYVYICIIYYSYSSIDGGHPGGRRAGGHPAPRRTADRRAFRRALCYGWEYMHAYAMGEAGKEDTVRREPQRGGRDDASTHGRS
jgi:hypothetical protein